MEIKNNFDELEGQEVYCRRPYDVRSVSWERHLSVMSSDLQGDIQSYVARDESVTEAYKAFKKMDIGDIVGIEGKFSKQRQVRFLFMQQRSHFFPRVCRSFRRSSMD